MGTDIELHHTQVGNRPAIGDVVLLAERIARTAMVPHNLRNKPDECLAVMLYGNEVGLPLMQSLQLVEFIDGKPCLNAQGQRALILGAGHEFWIAESTDKRAVVKAVRRGTDREVTVEFTMAEADARGLTGKANWKKMPADMLVARATSRMARQHFADCTLGLAYDPDELVESDRVTYAGITPPPAPEPEHISDDNVRRFVAYAERQGVKVDRAVYEATGGRTSDPAEVLASELPALREAVDKLTPKDDAAVPPTPESVPPAPGDTAASVAGPDSQGSESEPATPPARKPRVPGDPVRARFFALAAKAGWDDTERHHVASVLFGRNVTTFKDLSLDDYAALATYTEEHLAGQVKIVKRDDGSEVIEYVA